MSLSIPMGPYGSFHSFFILFIGFYKSLCVLIHSNWSLSNTIGPYASLWFFIGPYVSVGFLYILMCPDGSL